MINLVELLDDEEHTPAPCFSGNIVGSHACYCHHPMGPRKCGVWRNGDEWTTDNCALFEEVKNEH